MSSRWYVVYTKPRLEAVALENLLNQGFESWYPRARVVKRRVGGKAEVVESLFPRYVFVQLAQGEHVFSRIRSTRGCIDLVRFGFEYRPVPEGFVEALRASTDSDGVLPLHATATRLEPGTPVMLLDGAMAGWVGQLQGYRAADRVVVLMQMMGSVAQVEVQVDSIEAV